GAEARAAIGWRQPTLGVAGVRCTDRHPMAAPGQGARHGVREPRNPPVRPCVPGVRRHVEDAQLLQRGPADTFIGLHMPFQNTRPGSWLVTLRRIAPVPASASAALAVMLYASTLDNPFVYDDFRLIVENPTIQNLSSVLTVLARDATRPVVSLSYVAD